jgi:predicted acyl esterase
MYGISYDGETQVSVAGRGDPARTKYLKAIIPSETVGGQYEYSNFDGVPYVGNAALSIASYLALTSLAPGEAPIDAHTLERFGCQPELVAGAADTSGDMTPFWQAREYRPGVGDVRAATLWLHGFGDRNVQSITLAGFYDRLPATTPHKALFGQWEHNYPDNHPGVEPDWNREDWLDTATDWYDQYLKGLDTGAGDWPPVQVQDSTGQWRSEPSFPQAGGPAGQLGLGADGKLGGDEAPTGATSFQESSGQATWATEELPAPLHLVGQPVLDLVLSSSADDAHLAARLEVLGPDGAPLAHDGADADALATYGFRSLRHLEPMPDNVFKQAVGKPAPVGEPISVPIRFHPHDLVVPAGGRLRVTLSGSLSYARDSLPSGGDATITVHHECGTASALRFLMPHPDAPLLNVREVDETGALASAPATAGRRDGGGLASAGLCGRPPARGDVLGPARSYDCRPRVTALSAKARGHRVRVSGRARCAAGIEVSVDGRRFRRAAGRTRWSLRLRLKPGRHRLRARAFTAAGARGAIRRAKVRVR